MRCSVWWIVLCLAACASALGQTSGACPLIRSIEPPTIPSAGGEVELEVCTNTMQPVISLEGAPDGLPSIVDPATWVTVVSLPPGSTGRVIIRLAPNASGRSRTVRIHLNPWMVGPPAYCSNKCNSTSARTTACTRKVADSLDQVRSQIRWVMRSCSVAATRGSTKEHRESSISKRLSVCLLPPDEIRTHPERKLRQ